MRSVPSGTLISLWTIAAVPDAVEVVPSRLLDVLALDGDEREQTVARHDVVDQLDRALLADRERGRRVREDDRLLQRQDRQRRRQLQVVRGRGLGRLELDVGHTSRLTWIGTGRGRASGCAIGITIRSSPFSYVASAWDASAFLGSWTTR